METKLITIGKTMLDAVRFQVTLDQNQVTVGEVSQIPEGLPAEQIEAYRLILQELTPFAFLHTNALGIGEEGY